MGKSVFVIRECNRLNENLYIYGIYATQEKAIAELKENEGDLEFDEIRWIWKSNRLGYYYRIDEYTVVE